MKTQLNYNSTENAMTKLNEDGVILNRAEAEAEVETEIENLLNAEIKPENDGNDEALQSSELIYSDEKLSKAQVDTGAEILTAYRKGRQQFISGEYSTQLVCEYKKETNEKNKKELLSKIVETNAALVINIANKYAEYLKCPLEDAVQDGMLGLLKAVERFIPEKGYMFSTYATWWVRQSILREHANNGETIRVPVHVKVDTGIRNKYIVQYAAAHNGELPTETDIINNTSLTKTKLDNLMKYSVTVESYDKHMRDEDDANDSEYIDFIDSKVNVEKTILEKTVREIINNDIIACLTEREKEIIVRRFGLNGNKPQTLEAIGTVFGLTRERIRQIESNAIKKMRARTKRQHLTYRAICAE